MSEVQQRRFFGIVAALKAPTRPVRNAAIVLHPMLSEDLAAVEAIERAVYDHPWTLGNFQDSLASGYQCWVARDASGTIVGYFLLMLSLDESHLLNITVMKALHGNGYGRQLLEYAIKISRTHCAPAMLLEVRPSNPQALAVYRHIGFQQIGIRKRYYPAVDQQREDAIVMRLVL